MTAELARFLPAPDGRARRGPLSSSTTTGRESIGKVRPWYGVAPNLVRAYAWIMSLGAEGLREVAEIAVLNNNYLMAQVLEIRGVSAPYAAGRRRIEQVRYSWEQLTRETGDPLPRRSAAGSRTSGRTTGRATTRSSSRSR